MGTVVKIDKKAAKSLEEVMTVVEASRLWNLHRSAIRHAIRQERFLPGEVRQSGTVWLVTRAAMHRVYGDPPESRKPRRVRKPKTEV